MKVHRITYLLPVSMPNFRLKRHRTKFYKKLYNLTQSHSSKRLYEKEQISLEWRKTKTISW